MTHHSIASTVRVLATRVLNWKIIFLTLFSFFAWCAFALTSAEFLIQQASHRNKVKCYYLSAEGVELKYASHCPLAYAQPAKAWEKIDGWWKIHTMKPTFNGTDCEI